MCWKCCCLKMTNEGKEWSGVVSCKVVLNCVCDAVLKESKYDLESGRKGFLQSWEILKLLYFCSFPATLYIQNTTYCVQKR